MEHWPQNSRGKLWIKDEVDFQFRRLWKKIQTRWPGVDISEFKIEPKYEHVRGDGYDHLSDCENLLLITASEKYFERRMAARKELKRKSKHV